MINYISWTTDAYGSFLSSLFFFFFVSFIFIYPPLIFFSLFITFDCMIDMTFPSSSDMIVMYLSNDRLKNRMKINYYTLPQSRSLMSDGINLKARIHNTVLSLNDTPFVSRAFENDVFFLFFFFFLLRTSSVQKLEYDRQGGSTVLILETGCFPRAFWQIVRRERRCL